MEAELGSNSFFASGIPRIVSSRGNVELPGLEIATVTAELAGAPLTKVAIRDNTRSGSAFFNTTYNSLQS